jgi:hypothetical protein
MYSLLCVYFVGYLKENKLTKPGSKQFQSVIVWLIRSFVSFSAYVRYLRHQPVRRKTNAQNCHCVEISAHHYLPEDSGQVRIEYTHSQQYIYVKVSPVENQKLISFSEIRDFKVGCDPLILRLEND